MTPQMPAARSAELMPTTWANEASMRRISGNAVLKGRSKAVGNALKSGWKNPTGAKNGSPYSPAGSSLRFTFSWATVGIRKATSHSRNTATQMRMAHTKGFFTSTALTASTA